MLVGAYLEDFGNIKAIIPSSLNVNFDNVFLCHDKSKILKLHLEKDDYYALEHHLYLNYYGEIDLHTDYYVDVDQKIQLYLKQGRIIRSTKFDELYRYEGPLGTTYDIDKTIFRVWSPTAKSIKVELYHDAIICKYLSLIPKEKGLWEIEVLGDLKGYGYQYKVRIDEEEVSTLDPYAVASAIKNGLYLNYIVDYKEMLENIEEDVFPKFSSNEEIIYELHLKDYTDELHSSLSNFKTFTLSEEISSHLEKIGVNTIQVLPLNVFKGVDEINKNAFYNWGYNPFEYNVVTSWYASDPKSENSAIYELQDMVKMLHSRNLKINLDVVFNHVYLPKLFSYHNLVPGYFFRTDERGFLTDGSGCGNDFASERPMARRFIIDSLKHWRTVYHIDGFRFDLMGLLDLGTMKEIAETFPTAHLYGEGWIMNTGIAHNECANIEQAKNLSTIGYFNDIFRNIMRGSPFEKKKSFLTGEAISLDTFEKLMIGTINHHFLFSQQSINYIECHDNQTIYDYLQAFVDNNKIKDYVALGMGMILIAKGIPFIHAGQEILDTKNCLDNTYCDNTGINNFKWSEISQNLDMIDVLGSLCKIRKKYRLMNDETLYTDFFEKNSYYTFKVISGKTLKIFVKNNYEYESIKFAGEVLLIYNGRNIVNHTIHELLISAPGVYIVEEV